MLKEVLVVEGKMDTVAIKKAINADTIETGGFTLSARTLKEIELAYNKRGIVILTDPDSPGERIRRFLTERFPNAKQAFIPKALATANNDVGIEQAQPEAILEALKKAHVQQMHNTEEFTMSDLLRYGLNGSAGASQRREKLGMKLGIGCGNSKSFLKKLNSYGIARSEFLEQLNITIKEESCP